MSDGADRRASSLARFVLHPTARKVGLAVWLIAFAVGVGVYMEVINRFVHFSVRVQTPEAVEPGGRTVLRVHTYRPERVSSIRGAVEVTGPGDDEPESLREALSSLSWTTLILPVPTNATERVSYDVAVRIDGEPAPRQLSIELPIWPLSPSDTLAGLPPPGSQRRLRSESTRERARVQRVRTTPRGADIEVAIVAETASPVRFLENRFLVRVTGRSGEPLVDHRLTVHLRSDGAPESRDLVTDRFGLTELRATPIDLASWRVETVDGQGQPVVVRFEVVPGFDGIILRPARPIVARDEALSVNLVTSSTSDRWYYDVVSDAYWLSSGVRGTDRQRHELSPPGGTWYPVESMWRYVQVQAYTAPFSPSPQSSVRGVLIRPSGASDRDAVERLMRGLSGREPDAEYIAALRGQGLPDENTSSVRLDRLTDYLLARLLVTFRPPRQAYDDTDTQTAALLAETTGFRTRMHWLLGLGAFALVAWVAFRVLLGSLRTRRRTQALLAELPEDELVDTTDLAATRSMILPAAVALFTIAAFFVGVLLMLASM